ncbi:MAG: ribosomal protein S18-alanine N-acetyltransferase [Theionarchaea archaeon]|nr:ribosomal protein S18-alanine N-acetyltransferase [Theionarchaea archaeon]
MIVRTIEPDDVFQVISIEHQSFDDPYPTDVVTFLYERYKDTFLVADQGGTILGYIAGISSWREGHIVSLAMLPSWRKKGIASRLVSELCTIFKEEGKKRVKLEVRLSNKAAISLYGKLGFEKQKIVRNYYENGEDAVLMKKKI